MMLFLLAKHDALYICEMFFLEASSMFRELRMDHAIQTAEFVRPQAQPAPRRLPSSSTISRQ
jgi:hypothetical protein